MAWLGDAHPNSAVPMTPAISALRSVCDIVSLHKGIIDTYSFIRPIHVDAVKLSTQPVLPLGSPFRLRSLHRLWQLSRIYQWYRGPEAAWPIEDHIPNHTLQPGKMIVPRKRIGGPERTADRYNR
jgi:hypothetical protein